MKKEELFEKLRKNTKQQFDMPDLSIKAVKYPDTLEHFIKTSEMVGGKVKRVKKDDDLNAVIKELYPEAKVFASDVEGITIASLNPDTVAEATELNGTDVAILQGIVGVAENGCIWVPQTMKEKAVMFISENLVILIDKDKIVDNMHEGYKLVKVPEMGFGCWISGPSKTADIEQALVMGAQAARGVTVLIVE
ncbi:MAG: LUD domain-containing protein [Prevotella sp.]|nr:LUD domain-containing protein [Prevotella sp.]